MRSEKPALSVVVCTRDRPEDLRACVAAILANEGAPPYELLIVDQGDPERTRAALGSALSDPRVRYVVTETRGLSRARNVAVEASHGEALLFTDDDCRVPTDWAARAWRVLERDPRTAIAFGRVYAPPDLPPGAVVATFDPPADRVYDEGLPSPMRPWGIGANMLIARRVFEAVGRFDPVLSCAAELRAAEETDLLIRARGRGFRLRETSSFEVLHLGVRTGKHAHALWRTYAVATGAAYAKNLRLGTRGVAPMIAAWFFGTCWASVRNVFQMGRPRGVKYLFLVFRGGLLSLRYRLDCERGCLLPRPPDPLAVPARGDAGQRG